MSTHLMALTPLAAKHKWLSVLSFHTAVLDRFEAGLVSWGDDFTEHERFNITESVRFPLATNGLNSKISLQLIRQGLLLKPIVKNGIELALALTNLTRSVLSMCVRIASYTIASCPARLAPTNASPVASPSSA